MPKAPRGDTDPDSYWPLAALEYEAEIEDFADEAQMLGAIMILWNRQEIVMGKIFLDMLGSRQRGYAQAIWDRQPTHQARRDLLELALTTVKLTKRKKAILRWVLDKTKTLADRRNELIHAEYVVRFGTDHLHAKVKSPRSTKPAKFQKLDIPALKTVVEEISFLVRATESAYMQVSSRMKRLSKLLDLSPSPKKDREPDRESLQSG